MGEPKQPTAYEILKPVADFLLTTTKKNTEVITIVKTFHDVLIDKKEQSLSKLWPYGCPLEFLKPSALSSDAFGKLMEAVPYVVIGCLESDYVAEWGQKKGAKQSFDYLTLHRINTNLIIRNEGKGARVGIGGQLFQHENFKDKDAFDLANFFDVAPPDEFYFTPLGVQEIPFGIHSDNWNGVVNPILPSQVTHPRDQGKGKEKYDFKRCDAQPYRVRTVEDCLILYEAAVRRWQTWQLTFVPQLV